MYKFDHINVSTSDGGRTVRPSRYFDRFYDGIDPYDLSCKKVIWKDVAIHRNKVKLSKTSLDYEPMLAVENVSHPEEILSAFSPGALIKVFYFSGFLQISLSQQSERLPLYGLKIWPHIPGQLFLHADEFFRDIFRGFIRRLILIQITV